MLRIPEILLIPALGVETDSPLGRNDTGFFISVIPEVHNGLIIAVHTATGYLPDPIRELLELLDTLEILMDVVRSSFGCGCRITDPLCQGGAKPFGEFWRRQSSLLPRQQPESSATDGDPERQKQEGGVTDTNGIHDDENPTHKHCEIRYPARYRDRYGEIGCVLFPICFRDQGTFL